MLITWLASLVGAGQGVRTEHASPEGSIQSEAGPHLEGPVPNGPEKSGGRDLRVQSTFDIKDQRLMKAARILARG